MPLTVNHPPDEFYRSQAASRLGYSINVTHRLLICNSCRWAVPGSAARVHYRECQGPSLSNHTAPSSNTISPHVRPTAPDDVCQALATELDSIGVSSTRLAPDTLISTLTTDPETQLPFAVDGLRSEPGFHCPTCNGAWRASATTIKNHTSNTCSKPRQLPCVVQALYAGLYSRVFAVVRPHLGVDVDIKDILDQQYAKMMESHDPAMCSRIGVRYEDSFITDTGFPAWVHSQRNGEGLAQSSLIQLRDFVNPLKPNEFPLLRDVARMFLDLAVAAFNEANVMERRKIKSGRYRSIPAVLARAPLTFRSLPLAWTSWQITR